MIGLHSPAVYPSITLKFGEGLLSFVMQSVNVYCTA